jgi:hypothetical protein
MSFFFVDLITKADFISSDITITYKSQRKIKNLMGGLLSIMVILLSIFFFIYFSLDLFQKKHPKSYMISKYIPQTPKFYVNSTKDSLFFFLRINNHPKQKSLDETYISISAEVVFNHNNTKLNEYFFERCKYEEDFNAANKILFPMENINQWENSDVNYFCLKGMTLSNGTKIYKNSTEYIPPTIINGKNTLEYTYTVMRMPVKYCSNKTFETGRTTPCKSLDEIKNQYPIQYQMYFVDYYVDVENYDQPFVPYVNQVSDVVFPGALSQVHIEFNSINIKTQNGIIFEEFDSQDAFKFSTSLSQSTSDETDKIAKIVTMTNNMKEFYNRNYIRLQDVFANIGGILKVFVVCGQIINLFYSKFHDNVVIHNEILTDRIDFSKIEPNLKFTNYFNSGISSFPVLNPILSQEKITNIPFKSAASKNFNIKIPVSKKIQINNENLDCYNSNEINNNLKEKQSKMTNEIKFTNGTPNTSSIINQNENDKTLTKNYIALLGMRCFKKNQYKYISLKLESTNNIKNNIFDLKTFISMYINIFNLKRLLFKEEGRKIFTSIKVDCDQILSCFIKNEHFKDFDGMPNYQHNISSLQQNKSSGLEDIIKRKLFNFQQ